MSVKAAQGLRSITQEILHRKQVTMFPVPIREIDTLESLACGLRHALVSVGGDGMVASGAGLGNEYITVEWKGRQMMIRGSDLLIAWAQSFDPEGAEDLKRAQDKL